MPFCTHAWALHDNFVDNSDVIFRGIEQTVFGVMYKIVLVVLIMTNATCLCYFRIRSSNFSSGAILLASGLIVPSLLSAAIDGFIV